MNTNNTTNNTNTNKLEVQEVDFNNFWTDASLELDKIIDGRVDNITINDDSYVNNIQNTCLLSYSYSVINSISGCLITNCFIEIKIKKDKTVTIYEKVISDKSTTVRKKKSNITNEEYLMLLLDKIELILKDKNNDVGFFKMRKLFFIGSRTLSGGYGFNLNSNLSCKFALLISGKALSKIQEAKGYTNKLIETYKGILHKDINDLDESSEFGFLKESLKLMLKKEKLRYYTPVSRISTYNKKYIIEKYIALALKNSIIYIFYSDLQTLIFKADEKGAFLFDIDSIACSYNEQLNLNEFLLPQIFNGFFSCGDICEKGQQLFEEHFTMATNECLKKINEYRHNTNRLVLENFIEKFKHNKHIVKNPSKNTYEITSCEDAFWLNGFSNLEIKENCNEDCDFFYDAFATAYKHEIRFLEDQYYKSFVTMEIKTTRYNLTELNKVSKKATTTNFTISLQDVVQLKQLFYNYTLPPEEFELNI